MIKQIEILLDSEEGRHIVGMIGSLNVGDNQVLGKTAHLILEYYLGGVATTVGKGQKMWVNHHNIRHAVGAGAVKSCFKRSKTKGVDRNGVELKEGDLFVHIKHLPNNNSLCLSFYDKETVTGWLPKPKVKEDEQPLV